MNSPPTQRNCHARRSNGPSWMNGSSLDALTKLSLRPVCAMTHIEKLTKRTVFHPHRRDAPKAAGVRKENRTYIGRMSIKGGRKRSIRDPPIAAHGSIRYRSNKFLIPGKSDKKKLPRTNAKERVARCAQ